jgi:hypothetical protein
MHVQSSSSVVVLKRLWTCVSDFVSINHSTHCASFCGFMATQLIRKDGCSAVESNECYREHSETMTVSLADDARTVCLCLFIKVLFTSKVVKIIYIHPVHLWDWGTPQSMHFIKYYQDGQIKEDEVRMACSAYSWDKKLIKEFCWKAWRVTWKT